MSQEQINDFVSGIIAAGITVEMLSAMAQIVASLAEANLSADNLALLVQRAELSLQASAAALAIAQHDATTAQIETDRTAMRESLVQALINAQTAFVESAGA